MTWAIVVVVMMTVLGTLSGAAQPGVEGGQVLLDETFANGQTRMPLQHNILYLDGAGYALFNPATYPSVLIARPRALPTLPTYTVLATLAGVRGPAGAPYGIDLLAGAAEYVFEIKPSGSFGVQRIDGVRRTPLIAWTPSAAVRRGHVPNTLAAVYAAGLLRLFVNDTPVGWTHLPGAPPATLPGLINEGSKKADTLVRCTRFQVRAGPVVTLDDRFTNHDGAWPIAPGRQDYLAGGYELHSIARDSVLATFPGAVAPASDFTLDVTLAKVGGSDAQAFGARFLERGDHQESYLFLIDGAGSYALFQYRGHGYAALVPWTPTPLLRRHDAPNDLLVQNAGGTLTLGLNGAILRTITLAKPPPEGLAGLSIFGHLRIRCTHFLLIQPPDAPGLNPLQPAPILPTGRVVLADSFADNRNDWYTDGNTFVQNHAYQLRDTGSQDAYRGWAQRLRLGNAYSFAATIQLIGGSVLSYGYGLVFLDTSAATSWDLYCFEISGNGQYSLWRSHGDAWAQVIPWTRTNLIAQGYAANRLRVDVLRDAVVLYLNGRRLADAVLPAVGSAGGTVGFITSSNIHIAVSQAQVTTLRGSAPAVVITPRPTVTPPIPTPTPVAKDTLVQTALQRVKPSVVRITVNASNGAGWRSSGTGFLIRAGAGAAYIVTAGHVVPSVNPAHLDHRLTIVMQDGRSLNAIGLANLYPFHDVAVIKVQGQPGLQAIVARLGSSSQVQAGDQVVTFGYIGNPSDTHVQGGNGVNEAINAFGEVTNPEIVDNGVTYLTSSATLTEGFSGGPHVFINGVSGPALNGCVIGINDSYVRPGQNGGQNPNLNEVLPTDTMLPLINQLLVRLQGPQIGRDDLCH